MSSSNVWTSELARSELIGTQLGCNDTDPPEMYTAEQLSRVHDMLAIARSIGSESLVAKVFLTLDQSMRLEYNYSNWKYC